MYVCVSSCSTELKCKMKFAVYLPPKAETDKCPVMYWLSGDVYWISYICVA